MDDGGIIASIVGGGMGVGVTALTKLTDCSAGDEFQLMHSGVLHIMYPGPGRSKESVFDMMQCNGWPSSSSGNFTK